MDKVRARRGGSVFGVGLVGAFGELGRAIGGRPGEDEQEADGVQRDAQVAVQAQEVLVVAPRGCAHGQVDALGDARLDVFDGDRGRVEREAVGL